MAEYDNRNTFTLFRNTRKENEKHADFNGTFTDKNGVEHWVNAWSKTPKNGGEKFLSGTMKPKEDRGAAPPAKAPARAAIDDDVPF